MRNQCTVHSLHHNVPYFPASVLISRVKVRSHLLAARSWVSQNKTVYAMTTGMTRKSGFCLQLRLLLWKNLTIKKRHPIISLLEIVIPLTLFVVLLCIRRTQYAYPETESYYSPQPLPSSGVIPVLQLFCDNKQVYSTNNERLMSLLENIRDNLEENGQVLTTFITNPFQWLPNQQDFDKSEDVAEILKQLTGLPFAALKDIIPAGLLPDNGVSSEHLHKVINGSRCHGNKGIGTDASQVSNHDKHSGLKAVWEMMQPVLCGSQGSATNVSTASHGETFTSDQEKKLELFRHILYNNPKILFAPNNSVVQTIIHKVNASIAGYSNITMLVNIWQSNSENITQLVHTLKSLTTDQNQLDNLTTLENIVNFLDTISCAWLELVEHINLDVFRGFGTEAELEHYFLNRQYHDNVTVLAGLVFENIDSDTPTLPNHVMYKIRQNATVNPPTNQIRPQFWFPSPGSNNLFYYDFGFVWIQDVIERTIIELQTGKSVLSTGTFLHRMPYPCWLWDQFIWLIQHVLPLCLMLSWVYSVAMLVQNIVYEKEKRLKEVMKMMGLTDAVHWWGWFITASVQMTLIVTTLTLMLHYGRVLPHSNPILVFVFLELFALASIAFSFVISSLYSRAKLAAACAGIFYFITYVPYMYIAITEDVTGARISSAVKTLASIFPTSALGLGGKYFLFYELEGTGVQWNNLATSPREHDDFNLMRVFLMVAVDMVVYFVMAWYIENVHPGTFGIPKPWYFPFTSTYWCGRSSWQSCNLKRLFGIHGHRERYTLIHDQEYLECRGAEDNQGESSCRCISECMCRCEPDPDDLEAKVIVSNLRKKYSSKSRPALDGLSMKLYENQITAFLGHNGAGKTTTMSIMTGMFPPTSGTVTINGNDVRTDMDRIRQDLGMCPQHNILFDSLTVSEHLWFYSRLKGIPAKKIEEEIPGMLKDLSLEGKRHSLPDALSGGMQRKLSIAIAFVGDSRTVILDEPTAGVDPYSRRAIWKLLTKYKTGRTVMVSTHHLDEAEMLGDRILIIADGKLKCAGSPTFLKSKLGDGYQLCILKEEGFGDADIKIISTVKEILPSACVTSSNDAELHITIPQSSDGKRLLAQILRLLETKKSEIGIKSYGISDCGIENVFQKVTKNSEREMATGKAEEYVAFDEIPEMERDYMQLRPIDNQQEGPNHSHFIHKNQQWKCFNDFKAVILKRLLYTLRNRKAILSQIILPAVFVSISMTIALTAPKDSDPEPLVMSTAQYNDLTQPRGNFVPFAVHIPSDNKSTSSHNEMVRLSRRMAETLFLPSGISAKCVVNVMGNKQVNQTDISERGIQGSRSKILQNGCSDVTFKKINWTERTGKYSEHTFYDSCQCLSDNVGFGCEKSDAIEPPEWKISSGDIIQDITSTRNDEEQYFLFTTDKYKRHRYGGFTFGSQIPFLPDVLSLPGNISDTVNTNILGARTNNKVWYNQNGFHSMPVFLNALNNALLRASLKDKAIPEKYGITLTNHPMKKTNNLLNSDYIQGGTDVLMAIFIIIAMAFVPASFVVFLVHERAIKAKHLQFSSGLHPVTYWITNFFWDMCNYLIPAACILIILLVFHIEAYVGRGNLEVVIALFLLYGWSITPMMYPASFLFKEPSVAYICLILFNLFTGITCVVTSFMLKQFAFDKNLSSVNQILNNVFLIFPNYCLGNGMMSIALNQYENEYYSHVGDTDKIQRAMSWDVAGKKLCAMAVTGVLSLIFTLLCEYEFFVGIKLVKRLPKKAQECVDEVDSDVLVERERTLHHRDSHKAVLSVERLSRIYKRRRHQNLVAVDDMCFAVAKGECFGLLGVNGAGKTSTFRMLTGDLAPSSGDAKLLSQSVVKGGRKVQQCVGYCPQFDAIIGELTPKEHLGLYARLRGIPVRYQAKTIINCLGMLGLTRYADQPAGTLSGGNKRKLSTAIALVGNPPLILLDEPTSGMDPYSRRFLWDVIKRLVKEGTSVVFSSHSMEECEALCTRLSIMVKGQLKCLGSVQHLKEKYGNGYTLTVLMSTAHHGNAVEEYILSNVVSTRLKYRGHKTLVFDIKCSSKQLADVIDVMDKAPEYCNVLDYSLNQNTLDNVFVNFASDAEESNDNKYSANTSIDPTNTSLRDSGYMIHDNDEPLIEIHTAPIISSNDDCLIEV